MTVSLPTLIQRATSGKTLDKRRLFRPSWFYCLLADPFWAWSEYHAPLEARLDETTEFDRYRMDSGNAWEERYVAQHYPDAYAVRSHWGEDALEETLGAMLRGEAGIQGAPL